MRSKRGPREYPRSIQHSQQAAATDTPPHMCCVTSRPEYPPLRARHHPRNAAAKLLNIARANTKSTEERRWEKLGFLPAHSKTGTTRMSAIGKCTVNR